MNDEQGHANGDKGHIDDISQSIEEIDFQGDAEFYSNSNYFDRVVGFIEDILVDEDFNEMQQSFFEKHYREFEEGEENKLHYTTIFNEYIGMVESYIHRKLRQFIPEFSLDQFCRTLKEQQDVLEGEVFEMLFTLTDFVSFKEMMLDFKSVKEGRVDDLAQDLLVTRLDLPND